LKEQQSQNKGTEAEIQSNYSDKGKKKKNVSKDRFKPYDKNKTKTEDIICHRCGMKGHYAKTCYTSNEKVKKYQKENEEKKKEKFKKTKKAVKIGETQMMINYEAPEFEDFLKESDSEEDKQDVNENPETQMVELKEILTEEDDLDDIENLCLIDSGTSQCILQHKEFFTTYTPSVSTVKTIVKRKQFFGAGFGEAIFKLPGGKIVKIKRAVHAPNATRNLLSFKDLRKSGYELKTTEKALKLIDRKTEEVIDNFLELPNGLYWTQLIIPTKSMTTNLTITDNKAEIRKKKIDLWHCRLGHPSNQTMSQMIRNNTILNFPLHQTDLNLMRNYDTICTICAQGKLTKRPFTLKPQKDTSLMSDIHIDICGPITPGSGEAKYFMPIVDEYSRKGFVHLLPTRNQALSKILQTIVYLRNQFPENQTKRIRIDNAKEFTSKSFDNFCIGIGIKIEYSIPYIHEQNGIAENYNKKIQYVARTLLLQSNLPANFWGAAVLHANDLLGYWPHSNLSFKSPNSVFTGFTMPGFCTHLS
jgi:transposase InsO family protein